TEDNDSYIYENYTYINVTATDANNITAFVDWNNSLVGWWRFNNESGENNTFVKDWSSYGNNGSCTNCPNYNTGKFGEAMVFDGSDDYVNAGNDASLDIADEITIMAWVKPIGTIGSGGYAIISEYLNYYTQIRKNSGSGSKIAFWHAAAGIWFESNTDVPMNQWSFIVVTFNKSETTQNVRFYLNAVANGTGDTTTALVPTANNLWFGNVDTTSRYFNGTIDEVKIFNRALSAEEINSSYNAGLYRLETNITDLNEGTYTYTAYAQDLAGNVNQTETRTLTYIDDSDVPIITFISPTEDNNKYLSENYTYLNWSLTESNPDTTILNWNGTNYTVGVDYSNRTDLADGTYTYYLWANDTSGNTNQTETRTVTVDSTDPSIGFTAPTEDNDSYINEDYTYINTTVTDANLNSTAFIDWNNSLVGWWRFNNESGENNTFFRDWSSYGNNGGCTNCPISDTGKFGKGMVFDGNNDNINISLFAKDIFGLEFWFNLDSTNSIHNPVGFDDEYVRLDFGDGTNWESDFVGETIGITHYVPPASAKHTYIKDSVSFDSWHHFAMVWNGAIYDIYIDSDKKTTYQNNGGAPLLNNLTYIGMRGDGAGYLFKGLVDEVRIWNRALTASEINASYNAGLYRLETNITDLADGTYTYTAYAQDLAGNINQTETRTLTIDLTAPTLTIDTPTANGTYYSYAPDFDGTCTDNNGISYIWTDLSEYPTMDSTSPFNFTNTTGLTDQDYTINISCNDTAGNTAVKTMYFTFDTTDPSIGFTAPTEDNDSYINEDYTYINVTTTDTNNITAFIDWNNSLVGWWTFNEGLGTISSDSTDNSNDGTFKSSGLDFDGSNDHVITSATDDFDFGTGAFTVEAWINTSASTDQAIVGKVSSSGTYGWYMRVKVTTGALNLVVADASTASQDSSNTAVNDGEWHHVSVVRTDATTLDFYIDGVLDKAGSLTSKDVDGTYALAIGRPGEFSGDYFNGQIDEVRVYNDSLSAAEIARHYNGDFSQDPTSNLVLLQHFEEGMACDANDEAGCLTDDSPSGANDGTLKNFDVLTTFDNGVDGWITDIKKPELRWTDGKFGKAGKFNGWDDYVDVGDKDIFTFGDGSTDRPFSVEAWIIPDKNDNVMIVTKRDQDSNALEWQLAIQESNQLGLVVFDQSQNRGAGRGYDTPLILGVWYHVVATYDGGGGTSASARSGIDVYLNGMVVDDIDLSAGDTTGYIAMENTLANIAIGRMFYGGYDYYFNGTIDEVKIWDRALTPSEINASYNAGLYRLEANITDLAEGTYTYTAYAQDLAGNVNNTETRTLTVDTTDPQIGFIAPTEDNDSYINEDYT
ncbi:MAG: hypothetical protein KAI18_02335, partial [Candidatus Aenigmarchaeota archaeon]|nr:hypothetical protein [Candidatus Aenigmarchaeota archaeon]